MLLVRRLLYITLTTTVIPSMANSVKLKEVYSKEKEPPQEFKFDANDDLNDSKKSAIPRNQLTGPKERQLLEEFLNYLHSNIPFPDLNRHKSLSAFSDRKSHEVLESGHRAGFAAGSTSNMILHKPNRKPDEVLELGHRADFAAGSTGNLMVHKPKRKLHEVLEFGQRAGFAAGSTGNLMIHKPKRKLHEVLEFGHRAGFAAGSTGSLHHFSGENLKSIHPKVIEVPRVPNAVKSNIDIKAQGTSGITKGFRKRGLAAKNDRLKSSIPTEIEHSKYSGIKKAETNVNVQKYRRYKQNILENNRYLESEIPFASTNAKERNVYTKSISDNSENSMNLKTPEFIKSDNNKVANKSKIKSFKEMEYDRFKSNYDGELQTSNGMRKMGEESKYDTSQILVDFQGKRGVDREGYFKSGKEVLLNTFKSKSSIKQRLDNGKIYSENQNFVNEDDLDSNVVEKSNSSRNSEYDMQNMIPNFPNNQNNMETKYNTLGNIEDINSQDLVTDKTFESNLSSIKKSQVSDYNEIKNTNDIASEQSQVANLSEQNNYTNLNISNAFKKNRRPRNGEPEKLGFQKLNAMHKSEHNLYAKSNNSEETERQVNVHLNGIRMDKYFDLQSTESQKNRRNKYVETKKLGFQTRNGVNKTFESSFYKKPKGYGNNTFLNNSRKSNNIENEFGERYLIEGSKDDIDVKGSKFQNMINKIKKFYYKIPEGKRKGKFSTFEKIRGIESKDPNVADKTYEPNLFKKSKTSSHIHNNSEQGEFRNNYDVQSNSVTEYSFEKKQVMSAKKRNEGEDVREENKRNEMKSVDSEGNLTTLESNGLDDGNAFEADKDLQTLGLNKLKNTVKDEDSDHTLNKFGNRFDDESKQSKDDEAKQSKEDEAKQSKDDESKQSNVVTKGTRRHLSPNANNLAEVNINETILDTNKSHGTSEYGRSLENEYKNEHDISNISAKENKGKNVFHNLEVSSKPEDSTDVNNIASVESDASDKNNESKLPVINNSIESGYVAKLRLEETLGIKKLESRKSNNFNFRNISAISETTELNNKVDMDAIVDNGSSHFYRKGTVSNEHVTSKFRNDKSNYQGDDALQQRYTNKGNRRNKHDHDTRKQDSMTKYHFKEFNSVSPSDNLRSDDSSVSNSQESNIIERMKSESINPPKSSIYSNNGKYKRDRIFQTGSFNDNKSKINFNDLLWHSAEYAKRRHEHNFEITKKYSMDAKDSLFPKSSENQMNRLNKHGGFERNFETETTKFTNKSIRTNMTSNEASEGDNLVSTKNDETDAMKYAVKSHKWNKYDRNKMKFQEIYKKRQIERQKAESNLYNELLDSSDAEERTQSGHLESATNEYSSIQSLKRHKSLFEDNYENRLLNLNSKGLNKTLNSRPPSVEHETANEPASDEHQRKNHRLSGFKERDLESAANNQDVPFQNKKQKLYGVHFVKQKNDFQITKGDVAELFEPRSKFTPKKNKLWGKHHTFWKKFGAGPTIRNSEKQTTEPNFHESLLKSPDVRQTEKNDIDILELSTSKSHERENNRQQQNGSDRKSANVDEIEHHFERNPDTVVEAHGFKMARKETRRCRKVPSSFSGKSNIARKHTEQEKIKSCKYVLNDYYDCIFCSKESAARDAFLRCFESVPYKIRNIFQRSDAMSGNAEAEAVRSALCRKKYELLKKCLSTVYRKHCCHPSAMVVHP